MSINRLDTCMLRALGSPWLYLSQAHCSIELCIFKARIGMVVDFLWFVLDSENIMANMIMDKENLSETWQRIRLLGMNGVCPVLPTVGSLMYLFI
jgi:hypothetical protein